MSRNIHWRAHTHTSHGLVILSEDCPAGKGRDAFQIKIEIHFKLD